MKGIDWFKTNISPYIQGYIVEYRFFENGDLGDLNQVEFNSAENGGEIDFWSSGWLYVHLVDYIKGVELLNVKIEPQDFELQEQTLKRLQDELIK